MNQIEFRWIKGPRKSGPQLAITIDGRDLVNWLREYELPAATAEGHPEIAGSYKGLDARTGDLHAHFLDQAGPLYRHDEHTEVLTCGDCGEPGCWPLQVRLVIRADRVEWRDFRQPHRPHWDYTRFGPFVFARDQYVAAIQGAT